MTNKAHSSPVIRQYAAAMVLMAICAAPGSLAGAEESNTPPTYLTVTRQDAACVAKAPGAEEARFSNADPRGAIEWALSHSRIAVLTGGESSVTEGVRIPRSGVALIVAGDATLQAAESAEFPPSRKATASTAR